MEALCSYVNVRRRILQEACLDCTSHRKNVVPITLGVLGGFTGLVVLCVSVRFLWTRFRKTHDDKKLSAPGAKTPLIRSASKKKVAISEGARKSVRSFTLEELRSATGNFRPETVVGEGGFGLVYKGTLPSGQEVAIKHAHKEVKQGADDFYNEVELLSNVHHKYLVDLVGFCDEQGEQLLVYEFLSNGNLFEHLCGKRNPPLTWRQRVHIAICCAKGLAHLHEDCTPSVIHRDIKPTNILLDNDYLAKVADFGLSKTGPVAGASHVSTGVRGTPGYLDPYYYLNWHLGAYSDVYSFGVILLQLVASKPAIDTKGKSGGANRSLTTWSAECLRQGRFESIVDPKLRFQGYNRELMMLMVKLGISCTGEEIKQRPSMKAIYQELENALETHGSAAIVKGSPDSSQQSSAQPSEELTRDQTEYLRALYSKINFDGLSWVDIKNIEDSQLDENGQVNDLRLEVSDIQPSNNSVYISINSPELETTPVQ